MFCSCPQWVRLAAAGAALLLAGATMNAQDAQVLCAVKLPPAQTLSNQLMGLARVVAPGAQNEMYPMMFLGALGYPQFPGVSETENITLFFFKAEKGEVRAPMVILSKMSADAPMRKSLVMKNEGNNTMMSFLAPGLEVIERDGWTLFAADQNSLGYAQDLPGLIQLSESIEGFDLTARFYVGPDNMAEWAEQIKASIAEDHALMGLDVGDPSLLRKQSVVDLLAMAGRNLEWAQVGIDINDQQVSVGATVLAIDGTPESKLFSAPLDPPQPVAQLLPLGTLSYVTRMDMSSWLEYYEVTADRALLVVTPDAKPYIEKSTALARELAPKLSNTMVVSADFLDSPDAITMTSAMFADIDTEQYRRLMSFYFEELFPFLMTYFSGPEAAGFLPKMKLLLDVSEIAGQPVDALEQSYQKIDYDVGDPAATPSPVTRTDTTYSVIADGLMASSSQLETLQGLIERAKNKQAAQDSVAEHIQLEARQVLGLHLRLGDLVDLFTKDFDPQSELARQALIKLSNRELEPVTASITLGDNRMTYRWDAPVSTIQAVSETVRTIKQAEMEMDSFGGGQEQSTPAANEPGQ